MVMEKPFIHALLAAGYITILVLGASGISGLFPTQDNIFMPMTMLSLFVLSAAVMGYLFLSEPVKLYIDGYKKEAVTFFTKTVGIFAGFVIIFLVLIFLA